MTLRRDLQKRPTNKTDKKKPTAVEVRRNKSSNGHCAHKYSWEWNPHLRKTDLQKRPTQPPEKILKRNLQKSWGRSPLIVAVPINTAQKTRSILRKGTCNRDLHKRTTQKRPSKETYKRDLQNRPTKRTYKRDLQRTWGRKRWYIYIYTYIYIYI